MKAAILIFDELTALDAVGPYEVLSRLPGIELEFVAKDAGPKRTDTGALALVADRAISEVDGVDLLLIPGGRGNRPLLEDEALLDWVRGVHAGSEWTTSVCTGSMVLGAAGVLEGLRATSHWAYLERLAEYGATPVSERVVIEGKVVTAAGVSSGIDMALTLAAEIAGPEVAQAIQLGIEYDPEPPFDAGSPAKAPAAIVEFVRNLEG
ncbi:MAG: DJ-1/PfpI family protein [Solirubrobacterales bacterium]